MPCYDYKCDHCKIIFEDFVAFDKKDEVKCPRCDKIAQRGWWTQNTPSFSVKGGTPKFSNQDRLDEGIPFGEVPGDEDYEWIADAGKKNKYEFVEKNKNSLLGPLP